MAPGTLPSADLLRQFLDYDRGTGALKWRHRPRNSFRLLRDQVAWNNRNAGKPVIDKHGRGYQRVTIYRVRYLAHRIIFKWMTGRDPANQIDHINGNRSDNRWSNLREATHSQNCWNQGLQKRNRTRLKGVAPAICWPGRFTAEISCNGERSRLGYFRTPEAAHAAYCKAARKLHAEYANSGAKPA